MILACTTKSPFNGCPMPISRSMRMLSGPVLTSSISKRRIMAASVRYNSAYARLRAGKMISHA